MHSFKVNVLLHKKKKYKKINKKIWFDVLTLNEGYCGELTKNRTDYSLELSLYEIHIDLIVKL